MEKKVKHNWQKLLTPFYTRTNVLLIARELLGKLLVTQFNGIITAGRIVETEAYNGVIDKASHAYNNRRTNRTETMYANGGVAYVYLCYGTHHLFNIVTNVTNVPHAVLIRALEPVLGVEEMLLRTSKPKLDYSLTHGPGNLSKAMGISTNFTGCSLINDELFIATDGFTVPKNRIIATPRIGVDYAAEDALSPYRFIVKDNKYVSGRKLG